MKTSGNGIKNLTEHKPLEFYLNHRGKREWILFVVYKSILGPHWIQILVNYVYSDRIYTSNQTQGINLFIIRYFLVEDGERWVNLTELKYKASKLIPERSENFREKNYFYYWSALIGNMFSSILIFWEKNYHKNWVKISFKLWVIRGNFTLKFREHRFSNIFGWVYAKISENLRKSRTGNLI